MAHDPNDVVRVATGNMVEVEMYQKELKEAGVESKVVGLDLTAGVGTALWNSIELWVHRSDVEKARAAIKKYDETRQRHHQEKPEFPHPTNDPKPQPPRSHREPYVNPDPGS